MKAEFKTTQSILEVHTIKDIESIESLPYDELMPARNLYDLLLATSSLVGDSKALTVLNTANPLDVGASWTHRELLFEVTRLANMFCDLDLTPDLGVAAFLTPTLPIFFPMLLAAQVAGKASAINYLLSQNAIFDLLNAQKATILVIPSRRFDEMCWDKADSVFEHVASLQHVLVIGGDTEDISGFVNLEEIIQRHKGEALDFVPTADRDAVCAMFHTGGTTGSPKLVQLTHGNQIHAAFSFGQVFGYDENEVVINGFPLFHVGGTMTAGLSVLAAGGHIIVPSAYALRPPSVVEGYWDIVQHYKVTMICGVPTSIASITNSWNASVDTSSVRIAVTGGAVLPDAISKRFEKTTGIKLFETYGMTETAAAISFNPGRGEPVAGSAGIRAPFSEIRIVRLDQIEVELCGVNESGIVQVRGPQVFPSYLNTEHNRGVLDQGGWLNTGDVGYLDSEQRLFLTGREKDLIVRGGHNIDPAAIEDIADQFDGVYMSAAVAMPDQYAGEVPILFVVSETTVNLDALKTYLGTHIHDASARPKTIKIIDELPITGVGKIFKPVLRDMAIKEKVHAEILKTCGTNSTAIIKIELDEQRNIVVDIQIDDIEPNMISQLESVLEPLAQTYVVRSSEAVTLVIEHNIATLTLNRSDALNALSGDVMRCMKKHLNHLATLSELRVIILTGAGRAFCAGGDLIEFEQSLLSDKQILLNYLRYNQQVLQQVEDIAVPVIAAVNGVAVAGGLELLLCCDIIIASKRAKIGDGHTQYGIVPAGGGTVRLLEKISPNHAAQLFYTADLVDVETLREWGLVNEVVADEQLMSRAMEIAKKICKRSPEAIRHTKALINPAIHSKHRKHRFEAELEHFVEHMDGDDLANGLKAFRLKQDVNY